MRVGHGFARSTLVLTATVLTSCASVSDLQPMLRQHAECAVAKLQSMPNVSYVGMRIRERRDGDTTATVSYRFHYAPWHRRWVEYDLYMAPDGSTEAGYDGDHDTDAIISVLQMDCGLGAFLRV